MPKIRKYTPGIEELLRRYGVNTKEYFIPRPEIDTESREYNTRVRKARKNRDYYRKNSW